MQGWEGGPSTYWIVFIIIILIYKDVKKFLKKAELLCLFSLQTRIAGNLTVSVTTVSALFSSSVG